MPDRTTGLRERLPRVASDGLVSRDGQEHRISSGGRFQLSVTERVYSSSFEIPSGHQSRTVTQAFLQSAPIPRGRIDNNGHGSTWIAGKSRTSWRTWKVPNDNVLPSTPWAEKYLGLESTELRALPVATLWSFLDDLSRLLRLQNPYEKMAWLAVLI